MRSSILVASTLVTQAVLQIYNNFVDNGFAPSA